MSDPWDDLPAMAQSCLNYIEERGACRRFKDRDLALLRTAASGAADPETFDLVAFLDIMDVVTEAKHHEADGLEEMSRWMTQKLD